jgi:hypothetical protein
VVVGLSIRPSIHLCQIFQSSNDVCGRNHILTFGAKEFRDLVLLSLEVEIGGANATGCSSGRGHTGCILVLVRVVASIDSIIVATVVVIVVLVDLNVVSSNKSHFSLCFVFLFGKEQLI